MKRLLDVAASALGLFVLAFPFLVIAAAVRLDSPGPAFFRQERIGKGGRPFRIWKFRTMGVSAPQEGGSLTVGEDSRVTRVGRFLRRYKIDELPQLVNVLLGEMSLVGPRPEVPEYAFLLPGQERVWSVRPGITDPTSLELRDESDLLAAQRDPESYYLQVLLPRKTEAYLRYIDERSLVYDVRIILSTLWRLLFR